MNLTEFKEELNRQPIVISYFSYPECTVCKVLRPKIEALSSQYNLVGFKYLDTKEHPEIAGQYSIFTVPSILIFVEGKESKRLSRNFSVKDVQDFIERIIGIMEG
jgi:thioredoxin